MTVVFAITGGKIEDCGWNIAAQIPTDAVLVKETGSPLHFTAVDNFSVKLTERATDQVKILHPESDYDHLLELMLAMPVWMPTVLNNHDTAHYIHLPGESDSGWVQAPLQEAINNLVAQFQ